MRSGIVVVRQRKPQNPREKEFFTLPPENKICRTPKGHGTQRETDQPKASVGGGLEFRPFQAGRLPLLLGTILLYTEKGELSRGF